MLSIDRRVSSPIMISKNDMLIVPSYLIFTLELQSCPWCKRSLLWVTLHNNVIKLPANDFITSQIVKVYTARTMQSHTTMPKSWRFSTLFSVDKTNGSRPLIHSRCINLPFMPVCRRMNSLVLGIPTFPSVLNNTCSIILDKHTSLLLEIIVLW